MIKRKLPASPEMVAHARAAVARMNQILAGPHWVMRFFLHANSDHIEHSVYFPRLADALQAADNASSFAARAEVSFGDERDFFYVGQPELGRPTHADSSEGK